ncbi:MAG: class I SAM-dependent methyltransferase [Candidatus Omnitrophica bacterium]|nr:class I SAM-dependent methyltransferase [Candidatus Omnitrophota bacterium]
MTVLEYLKKIPVDLGQGHVRNRTFGKKIAMSLIPNRLDKKALDVGCSRGRQSVLLEKKGYEVTSVDIKKEYHKCRRVDVNERLPFDNESFDLVWVSEVIEHLDNPAQTLKEIRRVLKKDGALIATTPNSYFWVFRIFSLFGLTPDKLQRKDHRHFFNINDIRKLFPEGAVYGFFPYALIKIKISAYVNFLSPTFIIYETKKN